MPAIGRSRAALTVALVACTSAALIGGITSAAYFGDEAQAVTPLTAGRIFPGTRTSSAFSVQDASGGGTEVDRSSPFAVAADGLSVTTGDWPSAFSGSQYFQLDLSAPLPDELSVSSPEVNLTLASASPASTLCVYFDVRRASDDALQATYGSAANPLVCATGTSLVSFGQAISAGTSNAFNDLRVRVYGRDSASGGAVIDEATVTGSTPYAAFTLYPIRTVDATGATPITAPWELQGP
jgi:hypothetical protein